MLHPQSYASNNVATDSVSQARQVKCEVPEPGKISWCSWLEGGWTLGWHTYLLKTSFLREQYNRIHNWTDASDRDSSEDLRKIRKQAGKGQRPLQVEQDRIASLGRQQNIMLEKEETAMIFSNQNIAELAAVISKNKCCRLKFRLYQYCSKVVIRIYLQSTSKNLNIFCNLDYKLLF